MKITRYIVFIIFFMVLLPGCNDASSKNKTVLTYYVYGQASMLQCWQKICRSYEKQNPEIKINLRHVPGFNEYFSKILILIASGTAPDVIFMNSTQIPAFANRNALLPLDSLLSKREKKDAFFKEAYELFHYKKHLWALPSDLAIYVLYYNPTLFDRAGIDYPNKSWSWKELITAARKLTIIKEDNTTRQFGMIRGNPYLWIWQNGGSIVDDTENPRKCTLNTSSVVEAIKFMRDLEWKYRVIPSFTSKKEMDAEQMFKTGRVAMIFGGHWWLPSLSKGDLKFKIVMIPRGKYRACYCSGSGFSILANTKHPNAAKRFVKFLAGAEAQKMLASLNFGFPARKSIAQSPEFLNSIPGVDKEAFLESVPYLKRLPQTPYFNQIDALLWRDLENVWTLRLTPEETLAALTHKIDKILASKSRGKNAK